VLAIALSGLARAQEGPEGAYLRLHRATLASNLSEMMLYASEEKRGELLKYAGDPVPLKLMSSMMPRVYAVRSLATSPDGTRARMRATGTFSFMGTTAPTYGVVDLVREASGWKVDKFEWTGDKPAGFDAAVAQSPVRRAASGALEKVPPAPVVEPKPEPVASKLENPAPPPPGPVAAPVLTLPGPGEIQRSRNREPCVIKPVMTDEDLENCGATPVR